MNSGRCCSGIVGVTNPRYCVFGDTVNTTARHESTGEAGRVHGSMTTMLELLKQAPDDFMSESRGMIEMKGKGLIPTYWLSSMDDNPLTNKEALKALDAEVMTKFGEMLVQEECLARRKKKKGAEAVSTGSNEGRKASDSPDVVPIERSPLDVLQGATAGIDVSADDFDYGDSDTDDSEVSRRASSLLSPHSAAISGRSIYAPSKFELMNMLGRFIDGDAEIDELVRSPLPHGRPVVEKMKTELKHVVDEALMMVDM